MPRRLLVWLLHIVESMSVLLANLRRRRPRVYRRYPSWDLLKAHRIAQRVRDGDAVLDVGCGNGHVLDELGMFRRLQRIGVDLAPPRSPPGVELRDYDGQNLPFPDRSFDVTLCCYVLHHLSPGHARQLLAEMLRVTRRSVILLEDTLPRFGPLYRLRNRLHRIGTDLEYGSASDRYRRVGGEPMFLTHDGWRRFLGSFTRIGTVELQPLDDICKYAHHTMIAVELRPS